LAAKGAPGAQRLIVTFTIDRQRNNSAKHAWYLPDMFKTEIVTDLDLQPRWLRVGSACKYGGFSRAKLYEHLSAGRIKSVCDAPPGKTRGTRVIDRLSIDAFLLSLGAQQQEVASK
jgi:hypothetical protein